MSFREAAGKRKEFTTQIRSLNEEPASQEVSFLQILILVHVEDSEKFACVRKIVNNYKRTLAELSLGCHETTKKLRVTCVCVWWGVK